MERIGCRRVLGPRRAHRLDAAGAVDFAICEAQPFEPFDRWAQQRESQGKPLEALLDEFGQLRAQSLQELVETKLEAAQLVLRLTHLHQLSRILAYQYRKAVGPCERILGVMKCAGHSS